MRRITDIYRRYNILENIQQHQFRVAGVAMLICEMLQKEKGDALSLNRKEIVTACLLHDMGNILKIPLENTLFPETLEPKGLRYWQEIKREFSEKYGSTDHEATMTIVRELSVPKRVIELVDSIGFVQAPENARSDNLDQKICMYADMRVDPWGVVSLEERLADARRRYHGERSLVPQSQVVDFEEALRVIEKQIFSGSSVYPEFISVQSTENTLPILKEWTYK